MKLTEEQKIEIYQKRKAGVTLSQLSLEYGTGKSKIEYLVRLIDMHGLEAVRHTYHHFTPEFKLQAINRVLWNHESATSVAIDLDLSNNGTLFRWIKEFQENNYIVVEMKRGRKPYAKDTERDSYDTTAVRKKLNALIAERQKQEKRSSPGSEGTKAWDT